MYPNGPRYSDKFGVCVVHVRSRRIPHDPTCLVDMPLFTLDSAENRLPIRKMESYKNTTTNYQNHTQKCMQIACKTFNAKN